MAHCGGWPTDREYRTRVLGVEKKEKWGGRTAGRFMACTIKKQGTLGQGKRPKIEGLDFEGGKESRILAPGKKKSRSQGTAQALRLCFSFIFCPTNRPPIQGT